MIRLGKNADINIARVFLMFETNSTNSSGYTKCENVVMTFPAQSDIGMKNLPNDCNLLNSLSGGIWSSTLNRQGFSIKSTGVDTFGGVLGNLTTYSTMLNYQISQTQSYPIGIIGIQFNVTALNSLILPVRLILFSHNSSQLTAEQSSIYYGIYTSDLNLVTSNYNGEI